MGLFTIEYVNGGLKSISDGQRRGKIAGETFGVIWKGNCRELRRVEGAISMKRGQYCVHQTIAKYCHYKKISKRQQIEKHSLKC